MSNDPIFCPECQTKSKKVSLETMESLVKPENITALTAREQFRFCPGTNCGTVYFNQGNGQSILKNQMTLRVGQKEETTVADRTVCYCFSFSAEDLAAKVKESDSDSIPAYIKAQCKIGKDNCKLNNPQGTCCLGNVRAAIKDAQAAIGQESQDIKDDCCSGDSTERSEGAHCSSGSATVIAPVDTPLAAEKSGKAGVFTVVGAVVAAILASACCWLPLLLIAFGISGTAISANFEAWRPVFLPLTFVLLGAAFYFTYRKPRGGEDCCAPVSDAEDCCTVPTATTTGVKRLNKIMLWPLTAFILLMAFFPNYVGTFLSDGTQVESTDIAYTVAIEGMTCEACSTHVLSELKKVPGVTAADVNYDQKRAHVSVDPDNKPESDAILQAVIKAGYTPTIVQSNTNIEK